MYFEENPNRIRFNEAFNGLEDKKRFLMYFWTKYPQYAYPGHRGRTGTKEEREAYKKCSHDEAIYWMTNRDS